MLCSFTGFDYIYESHSGRLIRKETGTAHNSEAPEFTPDFINRVIHLISFFVFCVFLCPRDEESGGGGGILIYPCPSGYSNMVCPAISYSFRATALIFCMIFIHIMEVCMSTGFRFSSNILKMTGSWTKSFSSSVRT